MTSTDAEVASQSTVWQAIACAVFISAIGSIIVPTSLLLTLHGRSEVFPLFLGLASIPPLALWGTLVGTRLLGHPRWNVFSIALMGTSLALSVFVLWQWLRIDRLLWARYNPADPTLAIVISVVLALSAAFASFRIVGAPTKRPLAAAAIVVICLSLVVSLFNSVQFMPRFFEGGHRLSALKRYRAENMAGREAPGFALRSVDGGALAMDSLRGRVVVVDFWATWCGPCVQALPHLSALSDRFASDRVDVVALSLDRDTVSVRRCLDSSQFSFTTLFADDAVASAYQVEGIPTTFVIDQGGVVRFVHVGFHGTSSGKKLESQIVRLLRDG